MSNIKTIEGKVRAILYDVPATRNDDMKLYFLVCKECVKEKHGIEDISLEYAMNHYIELGLPNYETVRRSRAKIQATTPELACSPEVRRARNRKQREYYQYAMDKGA